MTKEIYLYRGTPDDSSDSFGPRIRTEAAAALDGAAIEALKITVTEGPPPALSVIPFRRDLVAVVSVYGSGGWAERMQRVDGLAGGYVVEEALPVTYDRNWADGEITPGVCLLTLFRRKPSVDYDTFVDRWHNGHTPLSLRTHPLWHYNRNVVKAWTHEGPVWYDGIVEEHTRTRAGLVNPFRFFGNPLIILYRMLQVYVDVNRFIDYGSIESYLAREYWMRSE